MTDVRVPLRFVGLAEGITVVAMAGNGIPVLSDSDDTRAGLTPLCIAIGDVHQVDPRLSRTNRLRVRSAIRPGLVR